MERLIARRLVVAALALSLGGCIALSPRLEPLAPQPTLTPGAELVAVPVEHVASWRAPYVVEARDAYLGRDDPPVAPFLRDAILDHRVLVGMSVDHVVFALAGHPHRIRRQGPPGGETYLWEPHRYWVRFDGNGQVTSAGRY